MDKIRISDLDGDTFEKSARWALLRKGFRFGGLGALLFISIVLWLLFGDAEVSEPTFLCLFVLAAVGLGFEFYLNHRTKKMSQCCAKCGEPFEKFLNEDLPDDTEYVYVCRPCRLYFTVMYGTKPTD